MYRLLPMLLFIALANLAHGEEFSSPNSHMEECRILPPIPGVTLSKGDQAKERNFAVLIFMGAP